MKSTENRIFELQRFAEAQTGENGNAPEASAGEEAERDNAPEEENTETETDVPETENTAEETAAEEKPSETSENIRSLRAMEDTLEQLRANAEAELVIKQWEREAESLKELYPGFELKNELKNEAMAQLVKAGVPLKTAYEAANLEKIIRSAMRYAALTAGKKAARAISDANARPRENSVLDRASSVKRTDVNSLTEKDILRIISEAGRGAKITFR